MIYIGENELLNRYKLLFNIWNDQARNQQFVRKFWGIIKYAPFKSPANQETWIKMRVLALAVIYREIISLLYGESSEIGILRLSDELRINSDHLITILSNQLDVKREIIEDSVAENETPHGAIKNRSLEKSLIIYFLDQARDEIINILLNYYQNRTQLFQDMQKCLSKDEPVDYRFLVPLTGDTPQFFNWILEDMPNTMIYD